MGIALNDTGSLGGVGISIGRRLVACSAFISSGTFSSTQLSSSVKRSLLLESSDLARLRRTEVSAFSALQVPVQDAAVVTDESLGLLSSSSVSECVENERRASSAAANAINGSHSGPALSYSKKPRPSLQIPRELDPMLMPEHVAIIMDGNSRWARLKGWPPNKGHEAGVQALREVVSLSRRWGIKVLTVFAFSIENWYRPKTEIEFLMNLFGRVLTDDSISLIKEEICIHFIGDLSKLPAPLRGLISQTQERTRRNTGLKLNVALSYSGRQDLVQACQALAADVKEGVLKVDEINESSVNERLYTSWDGEIGDPDVLIRTSGEKRLSNFLLWQMAYTELVFVDELWPDFGEEQYKKALLTYQQRERRFGNH